ncbi:anti-sigma factor, partial [Micromonospora sp. PSH25]|nr:anti-sigma factor [Micromonospora foliorum]
MQHLDHDRLVFLALGESEADNGESTHLGTCALCRAEVATLQQVAGLGTETQGLADLPAPPEHVWQGIEAQVRAAEAEPARAETRRRQVPGQGLASAAEQTTGMTAARSAGTAGEQVSGVTAGPTVTRL